MPSAATVLLLVAVGNALYLALLLLRGRFGTRQDSDGAADGIVHVLGAWTALLWAPIAIAVVLTQNLVLEPLRLSIEWGADHDDTTSNPRKYRRGRTMRRLVPWFPWVSVGTYVFPKWHKPSDRAATQTNRIVEIGVARLGFAVIRIGEPVPDLDQKPGPNADDGEHLYLPPTDDSADETEPAQEPAQEPVEEPVETR